MQIPRVIAKRRQHVRKFLRELLHLRPVFFTRAIYDHARHTCLRCFVHDRTWVGEALVLQMIVRVVESHGSSGFCPLCFGKEADLFFHARNRALPVLRELMENLQWFEHADRAGQNFFWRMVAVQFAQQSTDSFQTYGIRIALEPAESVMKFSHEPNPHEAAFHPIGFQAQCRRKRRTAAGLLDEPRQPCLRVTNLQQRRQMLLLMLEQRRGDGR